MGEQAVGGKTPLCQTLSDLVFLMLLIFSDLDGPPPTWGVGDPTGCIQSENTDCKLIINHGVLVSVGANCRIKLHGKGVIFNMKVRFDAISLTRASWDH